MIFKKLVHLKRPKATGADDIAPRLRKKGAPWLCTPRREISNPSISESTFPKVIEIAEVCPIPMNSQPVLKAFRPISLLSTLSQRFEQLVLDHDLLNLYEQQQHPFRPLASTTRALIDIVASLSSHLDSRETFAGHVTCLDLTKALDKLHHNRLLNIATVFYADCSLTCQTGYRLA